MPALTRLCACSLNLTRRDFAGRSNDAGDMRNQITHSIGGGAYNNDAKLKNFDVLLKLKISIKSYKDITYAVRAPQ